MIENLFSIRRSLHSDAASIIKIHERSIREICGPDYSVEQIEAWAGRNHKSSLWVQAIDRDFIWVVELNGSVQGFGHLGFMSDTMAEIMGLYFTPELKGMGAGKKLFQVMKEVAISKGCSEMNLHSTLSAKTFYEKFGFVSETIDSIDMRGVAIPCYPMKLLLWPV